MQSAQILNSLSNFDRKFCRFWAITITVLIIWGLYAIVDHILLSVELIQLKTESNVKRLYSPVMLTQADHKVRYSLSKYCSLGGEFQRVFDSEVVRSLAFTSNVEGSNLRRDSTRTQYISVM